MRKLLSALFSTLQGGVRGGLLFLALLATTNLWAYDFQSGELYYNITSYSEPYTVEVTCQEQWSSSNYSGLTTVTIPKTVTYSGITYSVTSIGNEAFSGCSSLASVTIPNSVMSIGESAFAYCYALTSVTIGNSVTSIGYYAFGYCSALTSITIPNSVTSIGDYAFSSCSSLTSITIPNSVTSIGEDAFLYCDSFSSIVVENGNTTYDSRESCNAIIETVTNTLIVGCQNTIIPNSVTSIGNSAFSGCSSLTSITIPNSVTNIGGAAFAWCDALASVTIGNGVTSIGSEAFYGCSSLTSVTIGNSVTSIGDEAFAGCSSLKTVICEAIEVPWLLGGYVFYDMPLSEATLYVPTQSLDDYKAAEQWKEFGRILPLEEAPSAVENTRLPITNSTKLLHNGQLIILRDGKTYAITGQKL